MAKYLLGIDIGTQATKGVVVRPNGAIVNVAVEEYGLLHPQTLWAEQWPEVWEKATYTIIQRLLSHPEIRPQEIAGLCVSSLYGGSGIPLDVRMKSIRPCLIWMDRRATEEVEWVRQNVDLNRLFAITGN